MTKIEINSQNKVIENKKEQDINSNTIQPKLNDEQNNNKDEIKNNTINDSNKIIIDSSSTLKNKELENEDKKDKEKEKEIEKIVVNKYGKKNQKLIQQSNKSSQSEDLENNNISNININSNTLNTTNDPNYSIYSTNSICNVNRFILNENILEGNDKVIKELASELEQSTNKKDLLASNKKKIEDNFKNICNKISHLNLNQNDEQKEDTIRIINENDEFINNNMNSPEKIKGITISTEKTEEPKVGVSNNFHSNINKENDYSSLSKKMEIFDKKLVDLEALLKQKLFEIFSQMDNLQNVCSISTNKKKAL